ncbi:hypothetical protein [Georgenia muralis]|uniref:Uncharacterized protein n=1 Tax=Georgenia muralis TaxID=154117 RepID=A0A3N4Z8H2_9MICO|nr:hypothetical protein [Georgenia muralis]RPF28567.1 hypothetical protein EDD32_3100 [Georgenia muralis]
MVFYVIFRFWCTLGLRVLPLAQAWMPTNHLVRWVGTDRGIKWGLPIGIALTPLYNLAMTWGHGHLDAGGTAFWWVPTVWGAINIIKFAHVAIRSPFIWIHRTVRRRRALGRELPARARAVTADATSN